MLAIAGILAAALGIAMIEVPSLLRKNLRKELWVFSILLLFATGLSIAKRLHVKIPNPLDWIAAVYKPFSDALSGLLQ